MLSEYLDVSCVISALRAHYVASILFLSRIWPRGVLVADQMVVHKLDHAPQVSLVVYGVVFDYAVLVSFETVYSIVYLQMGDCPQTFHMLFLSQCS